MPKKKSVSNLSLAAHSLAAAYSTKKTKGIFVNCWVKKHLGNICYELGRVLVGLVEGLLVGLDLMPVGKHNMAVLFSNFGLNLLEGLKSFGFGPSRPTLLGVIKVAGTRAGA